MAMLRLATHKSDGKANLHQGAVGVGLFRSEFLFMNRKDHERMGFAADDPRSQLVALANPLSDDWAVLPRLAHLG